MVAVLVLLAQAGAVYATDAEMYYQGNTAYWNGKYSSAVDIYRNLLRDYPRTELRPRVYFSLGSSYFSLEEYDKAIGWYEKLLNDENPADELRVDALFKLGQCYLHTGNYQRAGMALDELLQKFPNSLVTGRASLMLDQARDHGYVAGAAAPPLVSSQTQAGEPTVTVINPPSTVQTQTTRPPLTTQPPATVSTPRESYHVVRPGESLSSIASDVLGDVSRFREIAQANNIPEPYVISVGQRLRMPGAPAEAVSTPPVSVTPTTFTQPVTVSGPPVITPATYADNALAASLQDEIRRVREQLTAVGERLRTETLRADQAEGKLRAQEQAQARQAGDLEAAITAARAEQQDTVKQLQAELQARQERLNRTQGAFDALHLRYQELENKLNTQDVQLSSHTQLTESVVRKLKDMQTQIDTLTVELERTRAANEARTAQLTASYDQRLAAVTTALQQAETERARLEKELNETRLVREDLDSRLRQVHDAQSSAQQALSYVDQGRAARQAGNYPAAMAAYQQALARDPRNADALNGLAYVYAEMGDSLPAARDLVARAIENNPQAKGYYLDTLGWTHFRAGNYELAVRALAQALELLPASDKSARAVVSFHLGLTYMKQQERDKAFFAFIDTVNLAPGSRYAVEAQGYLAKL